MSGSDHQQLIGMLLAKINRDKRTQLPKPTEPLHEAVTVTKKAPKEAIPKHGVLHP
jgi:hypothetical protein